MYLDVWDRLHYLIVALLEPLVLLCLSKDSTHVIHLSSKLNKTCEVHVFDDSKA